MTNSVNAAVSLPCPVCGATGADAIYRQVGVPVHSVRLADSPQAALAVAKGDIELLACPQCNFVWNARFDPSQMAYDQQYEETQAYSGNFNDWQNSMATALINKYALAGKSVIEIGCGKGDFLARLVALGMGQGTGFDPTFKADRLTPDQRLSYVADIFPPRDPLHRSVADVYWCKMTLEHIDQPLRFVRQLRSYIADRQALVIFQVPALERILQETAFWDIYHEHCNYFCHNSLRTLFELGGFNVLEVEATFADQYLSMVATAADQRRMTPSIDPDQRITTTLRQFHSRTAGVIDRWRQLTQAAAAQQSILVWGAASKAVALLNSLPELQQAVRLVDINPHKHGTFLPSTGLEIESPEAVTGQHFELILITNPVYAEEISAQLAQLGVSGNLQSLGQLPDASADQQADSNG